MTETNACRELQLGSNLSDNVGRAKAIWCRCGKAGQPTAFLVSAVAKPHQPLTGSAAPEYELKMIMNQCVR
jgi:hypothetical protein